MAFEVTIINEVLEFVERETILTYILAFSTLGLAIITGLSLFKSNKQTQKQSKATIESNELLDRDIQLRSRPWLFPIEFKPTYIVLETRGMDFEKWAKSEIQDKPKEVRIGVVLKNTGLLPAKKFTFKKPLISDKEILREIIEKENYVTSSRDVFPNEELNVEHTLSYKEFRRLEENGLWFATMIKYDVNETNYQVAGLIGYLIKGAAKRRETWTDEFRKKRIS